MWYNPYNVNTLESLERNIAGDWINIVSPSQGDGRFKNDDKRLKAVLSNPAFLKVVKLLCDTFSLGKVVAYRDKKIVDNDPLVMKLEQPNFFQSQRQFLWDYMFWLILGNAYMYSNDKMVKDSTSIYFLMPNRFRWTSELTKKIDRVVTSKQSFKEIEDLEVEYVNPDGSVTKYTLAEITPLFDLSNGVGNWYRGNSSVDALYKIICNSEVGLDAKGTNLDFSRKFMVHGTADINNMENMPLTEDEVYSARRSIVKGNNVQILKSSIDIKRYVDNLKSLALDEQYWSDFFAIGSMYNIPKELLEVFNSKWATSESQEKALARLVEINLQTKGNDLMSALMKVFGYQDKGVKLEITWEHLSFMRIFKLQKHENTQKELEIIKQMFDMGAITLEEMIQRVKRLTDE